MDHATEMQVTRLDDQATQLQVPQGTVNIHFSTTPTAGGMEVITPAGAVELVQPGTYHIDAGTPQEGAPSHVQVTALQGQLEIRTANAVLQVMQGETAVLTGNPPAFSLVEGNATEFDNWALARERREEAHMATQYVSPYMTGYEDLDTYGQWNTIPAYGAVWYPTVVPAGWAPYRFGHWAFILPWGWTWIDDAPWGFSPFHYGRWARLHDRWCWVPGAVEPRPVYAPALVAFIGVMDLNRHVSSGTAPAVGWVPLAPHEAFRPYYAASPVYLRNVNAASLDRGRLDAAGVSNLTALSAAQFANHGAATVMAVDAFRQGEHVHKALINAPQDQVDRAQVTPTLAHLPPTPVARREGNPVAQPAQRNATGVNAPAGTEARGNKSIRNEPMRNDSGCNETADGQPVRPAMPERPEPPHPVTMSAPHIVSIPSPAAPVQPEAPRVEVVRGTHSTMEEVHDQPAAPHAPGPEIRRLAPPESRPVEAQRGAAALPHADVPHPPQRTQITPTPQGWQRMPSAQPRVVQPLRQMIQDQQHR